MTPKQQETLAKITEARAKERPELSDTITTTEENKSVFVRQDNLPTIRLGANGGIYLPDSKSFANSTPQNSPTPLELATFPEKYTTEATAARHAEKGKLEQPIQAEVPKPEVNKPRKKRTKRPASGKHPGKAGSRK
jgi:hypothetical protein